MSVLFRSLTYYRVGLISVGLINVCLISVGLINVCLISVCLNSVSLMAWKASYLFTYACTHTGTYASSVA